MNDKIPPRSPTPYSRDKDAPIRAFPNAPSTSYVSDNAVDKPTSSSVRPPPKQGRKPAKVLSDHSQDRDFLRRQILALSKMDATNVLYKMTQDTIQEHLKSSPPVTETMKQWNVGLGHIVWQVGFEGIHYRYIFKNLEGQWNIRCLYWQNPEQPNGNGRFLEILETTMAAKKPVVIHIHNKGYLPVPIQPWMPNNYNFYALEYFVRFMYLLYQTRYRNTSKKGVMRAPPLLPEDPLKIRVHVSVGLQRGTFTESRMIDAGTLYDIFLGNPQWKMGGMHKRAARAMGGSGARLSTTRARPKDIVEELEDLQAQAAYHLLQGDKQRARVFLLEAKKLQKMLHLPTQFDPRETTKHRSVAIFSPVQSKKHS